MPAIRNDNPAKEERKGVLRAMNWRAGIKVCVFLVSTAACSGGWARGVTGIAQSTVGTSSTDWVSAVRAVRKSIAPDVASAPAHAAIPAKIAIVNRVGNIRAVPRISAAADRRVLIANALDDDGHAVVCAHLNETFPPVPAVALNTDGVSAIAKGITGAYFRTPRNAAKTRGSSASTQLGRMASQVAGQV
jgi:hypothetical protein